MPYLGYFAPREPYRIFGRISKLRIDHEVRHDIEQVALAAVHATLVRRERNAASSGDETLDLDRSQIARSVPATTNRPSRNSMSSIAASRRAEAADPENPGSALSAADAPAAAAT